MKHPLLIALATLAALTPVHSSARDFSYTYEGQTITYTVLDEDAKTVKVARNGNVSGDLVLPEHPMDGDIEYTLTTIRNYAFSSCSALASIEIPNSVTTIGEAAFSNCRNLIEINVDSENQNYSSEDGVLFNKYKSNLIQYPAGKEGSYNIPSTVEAIGDYAFQGCSSLTSVEIPNSVTTIENYAFEDCSSLTSVEIPNSVTTIGTSAFRLCSALTSVEIPNSVTTIGIKAFIFCDALKSVEISNSVRTIGESAFSLCSALTEINVDSGNQYYSSESGVLFNKNKSDLIQCPAGKEGSYNIPSTVEAIEDYAFRGCSSLTSVEIPNSVTTIGDYAFYDCTSLISVEIPNSVTTIGESAFSGTALTSVGIPSSVTTIGIKAFSSCYALTEINVDSGNQYYSSEGGVLFNKNKSDLIQYPAGKEGSYNIPNTVTTIGKSAFESCKSLTSVEIPNSVTAIGSDAFSNCNALTYVKIPNSVTTIGAGAFFACYALKSVTCLATVPPNLPYFTFQKNEDSYLYVPAASVSDYENSDWAQYFTFIKAIKNPTGVDEIGAPDSGVRVSVWQNTVTITGLEPGARVRVHDVAGNMVYAGNEHSLTLPAGQAYIISTPSKTFKVAL